MKLLVALGCLALGLYCLYALLALNWDELSSAMRGM